MAHVFGVGNSSPAKVSKLLITKGVIKSINGLAILPLHGVLSTELRPTRPVLFVLTISDLLRNLKVFNSVNFKDCSVFVFTSPIRLAELTNVALLDVAEDPSSKGFGFLLRHTLDFAKYRQHIHKHKATNLKVNRNDRKHLTILIDSVKKGSLLAPLMTFIYSLPSSTLQTPVKIAIAKIITKGYPLSKIDKLISEESEYELTLSAKEKLFSILSSDVGIRYKSAFKEYKKLSQVKGSTAIDAVSKKYDVSPYELRYILSVLDTTKKADTSKLSIVKKKELL